jgi:hypothetical protein
MYYEINTFTVCAAEVHKLDGIGVENWPFSFNFTTQKELSVSRYTTRWACIDDGCCCKGTSICFNLPFSPIAGNTMCSDTKRQ